MAATVARQEDEVDARELAEQQSVGWRAERGGHGFPARANEPIELIEPAAADDAEDRPAHGVRV